MIEAGSTLDTGLVCQLSSLDPPRPRCWPRVSQTCAQVMSGSGTDVAATTAGTGKTLLARAVANRTDACFIRVIGSELVQKYVGEGARMVRELFQMARSKKACLIFFDEVRCGQLGLKPTKSMCLMLIFVCTLVWWSELYT